MNIRIVAIVDQAFTLFHQKLEFLCDCSFSCLVAEPNEKVNNSGCKIGENEDYKKKMFLKEKWNINRNLA
jgi:hypothetical protein